jgi:hypothetical protein
MTFTRTPGGLAEKWRFHQVPTIWIEGHEDLFFYLPITARLACRYEAFNGCKNADSLISALLQNNHPYLVILDGDYSILKTKRSPHPHIITLPRYSYENLLWEPEAVNKACARHARCGENKDLVLSTMARFEQIFETHLLPLIVLDIAAREMENSPKVLPHRADHLFQSQKSLDVSISKIDEVLKSARGLVRDDLAAQAQTKIEHFLEKRKITHLIHGHLLFSFLRRIFVRLADIERGSTSSTCDDALRQLLSDAVWLYCRDGDHGRLKRKLRSKLRKISAIFDSAKQLQPE